MFTIGSFNTGHRTRTWTPTIANTVGVDASTPYATNFLKIGDAIIFWGHIDLDLTSAAAFSFTMTLPTGITSNFADSTDAGGTLYFIDNLPAAQGGISADTANNLLLFSGRGSSNSSLNYHFYGIFKII